MHELEEQEGKTRADYRHKTADPRFAGERRADYRGSFDARLGGRKESKSRDAEEAWKTAKIGLGGV